MDNDLKENGKIQNTIELSKRYSKASDEYWNSIYDLEQYVLKELCNESKDFVEVVDDCINIRAVEMNENLINLENKLIEENVPFELEEEAEKYTFVIGIYDLIYIDL